MEIPCPHCKQPMKLSEDDLKKGAEAARHAGSIYEDKIPWWAPPMMDRAATPPESNGESE
jgi:hypothetical protein